jgi:hypothetical protein
VYININLSLVTLKGVRKLLGSYIDIKDWYNDLDESKKLLLWQSFSVYLNDFELKLCMSEVRKGKSNLFDIHYKNGLIEKYQIYFNQVMIKINDMGEENGRGS